MSTEINIRKRIDIQEEGVSITPDVNSINFIGAGVTASTAGDNVTVNVQGSIGATAYYLNETVTQAPYKEFSSIPTLAAEQTIATVVGVGATATIQSFQTPSGVPNTTNIPAGLWQFYLHFSGTSGDSWDVYAEVYKRDLGGIETLLLTTDVIPTTVLSAIPTMILTDGVFPASTVLTTDRIVVKVLATNTGVAGQTITFHTEGSTNYSVGTTTLNQIVPTGAVTSVTGTAPVVSSGGTTPAISMPQANGTTDGYLDSADWTTFNNKVDDNIYTADGTLAGNRTVTMSSNTLNFSGGKVGINQSTPAVPLHVISTAIPSTNEQIFRLGVSDAAGYFSINNASSTNGVFIPELLGRQSASSNDVGLYQGAYIDATQDSGTTPVTIFRSALHTLTQVVTRPIFQFNNWSTNVMTMLANGNVGIGTTTPTEKLEVSGKTKTTTFQMTTTPTAGYVLTSDASGNGTWSAAAGGLTYFTEAQSTAAPNATVPVDSLTAVSATTNADVAIRPKGTGAILAAIPDNAITGGNKRGDYSVDLQLSRSAANQVVSGTYSFAAGSNNRVDAAYATASGQGCIVTNNWATAIGRANTASGDSSVALGFNSTASNNRSIAIGESCNATGISTIAIGASNTSNISYATAIGYLNTASGTTAISIGQSNTASGLNAVALGQNNISSGQGSTTTGILNTASGGFSFAGGNGSSATGAYGFAFGYYTTAGGAYSYAIGRSAVATNESYAFGWAVNASGQYSLALGASTVASGQHSTAMGLFSSTLGIYGRQTYASGVEAVVGDSQASKFILRERTTDASATALTTNSSSPSTNNQIVLSNQSAYGFTGTIVGKQSGSTNAAMWKVEGLIARGANAVSTVLTTSTVTLVSNAPGWGTPNLSADPFNGGLQIQVVGAVATNIQWTATIDTTEVIYA